ncbi:MAG: exodeoxyribonuclease I [Sulfuriferula sp.]
MHTFLWHDYETFGVNPRRDRPAQFAAIRTDVNLNEIGEPMMWYCQPAPDYLPDPQSCLITGITPQTCLAHGISEYQFARLIEQAFAQPNTVGVGFNTLRFDDEVTRFLLWRNLIDPYAREWQNGCGRWDLLDLVRATYALRPMGINWPLNAEGRVSFRLEHLTAANGLDHQSAHDALSDVRATIALARLIRERQPRLFDYCFKLHKKDAVAEQISLHAPRPFLHITGMVPVERGCVMLAWPLSVHPTNKNEIIIWDLAFDPAELHTLDAATIRTRLFSKTDALAEGVSRLPIKTIHLNKSPVVISQLKTLEPDMAARWGINMEQALQYAAYLRDAPDLTAIWHEVYQRQCTEPVDVDEDLYNGFIGNNDRRALAKLHDLPEAALIQANPHFDDARLEELLFRFRARNFPHLLSAPDSQRWQQLRAAKLFNGVGSARTLEQLFATIDMLAETADERAEAILSALYDYAVSIAPERAS